MARALAGGRVGGVSGIDLEGADNTAAMVAAMISGGRSA